MESSNSVREILERMLSSYGVNTRQAYADLVGIPIGTVNNWLKRESLPGDYLVQCALDTGADVIWLKTGELANVRFGAKATFPLSGIKLIEKMEASGGKIVLRRILDAYGFTLQKQLGDHLNIPSGTMSAWVRREHFPGDVVIVCALDTGVSLYWLATGIGEMRENKETTLTERVASSVIKKFRLENGELKTSGNWLTDPSMLPDSYEDCIFVEGMGSSWLVDTSASKIGNGRWLISIDGAMDVFNVIRLPGNKARLSNGTAEFECNLSDITPSGAVVLTLEKHM